jgi:hypothetical protein
MRVIVIFSRSELMRCPPVHLADFITEEDRRFMEEQNKRAGMVEDKRITSLNERIYVLDQKALRLIEEQRERVLAHMAPPPPLGKRS